MKNAFEDIYQCQEDEHSEEKLSSSLDQDIMVLRPESREKLQLLNADAGIEVNDFQKGSTLGLNSFLV